jgi:predicted small lipoprotein YifL
MFRTCAFILVFLIPRLSLAADKDIAPLYEPPEAKNAPDPRQEADQWVKTQAVQEAPKPALPEPDNAAESPRPVEPPQPAEAPKPAAVKPRAATPGLNEMTGTVQSIGNDPRVLRLSVEGGYSVEFTFDKNTVLTNGGSPIKADELSYGDKILVRYAGKELNAIEIERLSKSSSPLGPTN